MFADLWGLLFGQIAAESTRDPTKRSSTYFDRNTDALSGAASAVLGSFGLLLGLSSVVIAALADTSADFAAGVIVAIVAFGCSYFGSYFGRRAPHVTDRFLGMARFAVVVSSLGAVASVTAPIVAAVKTFL